MKKRVLVLLLCSAAAVVQAQIPEVAEGRLLFAEAQQFEHGEGVGKDTSRAAQLYCKAAKLGHADAQFNLAWMYANGRGVARNDALAATFFDLAARQGHAHAQQMLRYVGDPTADLPECMRDAPPAHSELADADRDFDLEAAFATTPDRKKVIELVLRLAPQFEVDPKLVLAVIGTESNFNPKAKSPKNAQGLMQLIPETAQRFNVRDTFDPAQNIKGGITYLRWLLAYFRGDVALAAAGYNAGEGAVDRYKGVPPYQETREYVKRILSLFRKQEHPYDERVTGPSPVLGLIKARRG